MLTGAAFGLTTAIIWAGFPALTQLSIEQSLTPYDITALRLGSRLVLGDRITRTRLVGMLTIVAGLVALGWEALASFGGNTWIGDLMFAGGGVLWATYTVASRYFGMRPIHATAIVAVFSLIGFMPYYLATSGLALLDAPLREVLVQAVF